MSRAAPYRRGGFTLIEIMAAVSVLAIIVVFMANVFANTSKVWKLGNKRVESNNTGRAAIEFVARELSSALISGTVELELKSDADPIYGSGKARSDRIAFASTLTTPQVAPSYPVRELKQSVFAVISTNGAKGPYMLMLHNFFAPSYVKDIFQEQTEWTGYLLTPAAVTMGNSSVIAENVRNFEVFVYNQQATAVPDYKSWVHGPPLFIDVYLEVLAEEDAVRAGIGMTSDEELTRATRRYHTRVFMPNVQGAMRD